MLLPIVTMMLTPMILVESRLRNFIPGENCGTKNAVRVVDKPENDDEGCLIVNDDREYRRIMEKRLQERGKSATKLKKSSLNNLKQLRTAA